MDNTRFFYQLKSDTIVFMDTLSHDAPYVSPEPRDHESLFFVTKGTGLYIKDGKEHKIEEGQVGYISRGSVDISSAPPGVDFHYIAINFSFDKENRTPSLPFDFLCSDGSTYNYKELFQQALNHFVSNAPGSLNICNGVLLQIIGHLYNEYHISSEIFQKIKKIKAAMRFLEENFSNPDLEINTLAKITNMSEKQFRRIFMDVYQVAPYQYLQNFRINKAKILLTNTSKSVSEIALQCGFSDVYSFSHCFKSHTGVSPKNYAE